MGKGKGTFEFWATRYVRCHVPRFPLLTFGVLDTEYLQAVCCSRLEVFQFVKSWPGKVRSTTPRIVQIPTFWFTFSPPVGKRQATHTKRVHHSEYASSTGKPFDNRDGSPGCDLTSGRGVM